MRFSKEGSRLLALPPGPHLGCVGVLGRILDVLKVAAVSGVGVELPEEDLSFFSMDRQRELVGASADSVLPRFRQPPRAVTTCENTQEPGVERHCSSVDAVKVLGLPFHEDVDESLAPHSLRLVRFADGHVDKVQLADDLLELTAERAPGRVRVWKTSLPEETRGLGEHLQNGLRTLQASEQRLPAPQATVLLSAFAARRLHQQRPRVRNHEAADFLHCLQKGIDDVQRAVKPRGSFELELLRALFLDKSRQALPSHDELASLLSIANGTLHRIDFHS